MPRRSEAGDRVSGLSLRALAALALAASVLGRALAPAIPGLAVGIDAFIGWSTRVSAFLSQFVALGSVAAVLFLAARVFRSPAVQFGYRMVVFPATAIVVALAIASASGQLPPELCRVLLLATASTALAAGVTSVSRVETRAAGLVLMIVGASELLRFAARGFEERAAQQHTLHGQHWTALAASGVAILDVAAALIATRYVGGREPRRASLTLLVLVASSLGIGWLTARGAAPDARNIEVFALRAIGYFSRPPLPPLPALVRHAVAAAPLLIAAWALVGRGSRDASATVIALGLMSLGALDMPLPALLVVVASLLARLPMTRPAEESRTTPRRAGGAGSDPVAAALPRR